MISIEIWWIEPDFSVGIKFQFLSETMDCKTGKQLETWDVTLVPFYWSWLLLSDICDHHLQTNEMPFEEMPQDAFEDTTFKPGFEIVEFSSRL